MLRQCLFFLVCISFCAATRNSVPTGIADHYCCSVPNKVETIETRTRIVTQINIVTSQVISNYTYCPPLDDLIDHIISNLGNKTEDRTTKPMPIIKPCISKPIYSTITSQKVSYKIESYQVPVVTVSCKPEHQICCEGYVMLSGQCLPEDSLDSLQDLIDMGIIGK